MMKVVKIKGLCSRPLQQRVLAAGDEERAALLGLVEKEKDWMIHKMRNKGFELEGTVAGVYGIFTRGSASGTLRVLTATANAS